MQEILNIIVSIGTPYSEVLSVALLFSLAFLIVYLTTLLFEKKKDEPEIKESKEKSADTVSGKSELKEDFDTQTQPPPPPEPETKQSPGNEFTSSVNVSETVSQKVSDESGIQTSESTPQEISDEFKPSSSVSEITEETPLDEQEGKEKLQPEIPLEEESKETFFSRLKTGLSKTQQGLFGRLGTVFSGGTIDEETWDEFEEILITSDIGMATTMKLRESLSSKLDSGNTADIDGLKSVLKGEVLEILKKAEADHAMADNKPYVLMVAGVNGVGKTTTIGKLANMFTADGKKVMVAAADTFRAAAVEQLEVWSERVGSDFLRGSIGADPSSVAFDAVEASVARGIDVLIVDTAGRLHTKSNLMDELKKLRRVIGKALEGAPHETLLVLDATTGQNAVQQARLFNESIEVSGIVLTKLDGTAKGGVIITIADELNIPVQYIGVGEGLNDLRDFKAEEFVEALFMTEQVVH